MILKQETEIKMFKERLKEEMVDAMEKTNRKTYEDDNIRIIYKKGSTRTTIDSKRLKEEQPTIFYVFSKTSETKASISMELK